jgi:hypothetical protein
VFSFKRNNIDYDCALGVKQIDVIHKTHCAQDIKLVTDVIENPAVGPNGFSCRYLLNMWISGS